ncbi:MAG: hypothetical protein JSR69_09080 [Proteobacteria bacterium]|nr:hypothetical protein [Pseudomonadota bacterium]
MVFETAAWYDTSLCELRTGLTFVLWHLTDIESGDKEGVFNNNTYITSAYQKHDIRNFFLRMAMDLYFHRHGKDVLTNLRSLTHWGRPQWQKVFQLIRDKHPAIPSASNIWRLHSFVFAHHALQLWACFSAAHQF